MPVGQAGLQTAHLRDMVAPLSLPGSEPWFAGCSRVFQAHLYMQADHALVHQTLGNLPAAASDTRPRVVLARLAGEPQGQTTCPLPTAVGRVRLLLGR